MERDWRHQKLVSGNCNRQSVYPLIGVASFAIFKYRVEPAIEHEPLLTDEIHAGPGNGSRYKSWGRRLVQCSGRIVNNAVEDEAGKINQGKPGRLAGIEWSFPESKPLVSEKSPDRDAGETDSLCPRAIHAKNGRQDKVDPDINHQSYTTDDDESLDFRDYLGIAGYAAGVVTHT